MKNIIFDTNYRPSFSGHETFALRQMWLVKAYNAVASRKKSIFSNEDAIVTFGVGKNMVSSIKHWAIASGIVEGSGGSYAPTELGEKIFGDNGLDKFCEQYATSWLTHWNLAGRTRFGSKATTWYLAFNHIGEQTFQAQQITKAIEEYLERKVPQVTVSPNTLKNDVNVFFNTYVSKASVTVEDVAEPMLAELGLIQISSNGLYEFRRGPKATLPDSVFLYALIDYWQNTAPNQKTLSFESIAYDPGSPGRVFKLDEDSIAERLINLDKTSQGKYLWSDTAGQKNVICLSEMSPLDALEIGNE